MRTIHAAICDEGIETQEGEVETRDLMQENGRIIEVIPFCCHNSITI